MTQLLADVVLVLTQPHTRRTTNTDGETIYGQEPPLLDILEDCVASDSGKGSASGVARTGSPVDLGALDLAEEVKRTTQEHAPINGLQKAPLRLRVNAWYANTFSPDETLRMHATTTRWAEQIRELIEPTKRIPLPGVECPVCKFEETISELDGERTRRPILIAYPHPTNTRIECTSEECSGEWEGKKIAETFKTMLHT